MHRCAPVCGLSATDGVRADLSTDGRTGAHRGPQGPKGAPRRRLREQNTHSHTHTHAAVSDVPPPRSQSSTTGEVLSVSRDILCTCSSHVFLGGCYKGGLVLILYWYLCFTGSKCMKQVKTIIYKAPFQTTMFESACLCLCVCVHVCVCFWDMHVM